MAFGLKKSEIESLFMEMIIEGRRRYLAGGRLDDQQATHIALAISETIAQNNVRILEALNNAGIKLKLD